ncbi:PREDICTED: kynurenine--oxoglutarate transaminase 1-like isoform X2 [Populus euphratica]|uniref:Kynurenine--oxoglutarate transaminase 1-like isoform X2 n=1 Tax=Populus euphratica TaxID=75702 RepID=A0AAJ6V4Y0_POPEU|nr:PREDICTED: kynurenine--oxoglutarate transaminase 1-like isoform X2 [Populus euphratica]
MEQKLSSVAKTFTPSPIQELSHLAQRSNAINLAEGFPDFPAPSHLKKAAISAINSDFNQYRHVQGICDHLANIMKEMHGLDFDPRTDMAICCGQTEAFAAAVFAIIDPGDEVVLFDPSYETYEGCIRMAGGIPVYVALEPPHWTLDPDRFINSFTARTKAVILNSPHNPTGKVFTKDELETIAGACCRRDCMAITDEVYEHITYDNIKHISLASFPGMQERTIITSSLSKTFSVTDSAPAPFQEAALTALRSPPEYFEKLRREYESKRDYIVHLIAGIGFQIKFKPRGAFFLFAELPENYLLSDVEYVKELIKRAGVVAVPGCGFFHTTLSTEKLSQVGCSYQERYIRFAFCKSSATLAAAAQKLAELSDAMGGVIGGKNA